MTFFIAHFVTAGIKGGGIDIRGSDGSFGELKTAAAVMQERCLLYTSPSPRD